MNDVWTELILQLFWIFIFPLIVIMIFTYIEKKNENYYKSDEWKKRKQQLKDDREISRMITEDYYRNWVEEEVFESLWDDYCEEYMDMYCEEQYFIYEEYYKSKDYLDFIYYSNCFDNTN